MADDNQRVAVFGNFHGPFSSHYFIILVIVRNDFKFPAVNSPVLIDFIHIQIYPVQHCLTDFMVFSGHGSDDGYLKPVTVGPANGYRR